MKNQIALFAIIAAALLAGPASSRAEDKPAKPVAADTAAPGKKQAAVPLNGKVSAVDTTANTVTLGKRTFQITSETKILKNGQPATCADITVGEKITGQYKKEKDAGKLVATSLNIGGKVKAKKKAEKTE